MCSAGINAIRVKFERNFYLTNEPIRAKCYVDNTRTTTVCEKILIRLIRTVKAYGMMFPNVAGAAQQNRQLYPFEENIVVAN
jgi:hypothetical protein